MSPIQAKVKMNDFMDDYYRPIMIVMGMVCTFFFGSVYATIQGLVTDSGTNKTEHAVFVEKFSENDKDHAVMTGQIKGLTDIIMHK